MLLLLNIVKNSQNKWVDIIVMQLENNFNCVVNLVKLFFKCNQIVIHITITHIKMFK